MYRSPDLPKPKAIRTYSDRLLPLWLEALARPEADLRCQAAYTIAMAHQRGMAGLGAAVPDLARELDRPGQHPSVLAAAARALVVLDAKETAPALFRLAATGDNDLREIIEPALARWDYAPAREDWLRRVAQPPPYRRGVILAIKGLGAAREEKAVPRLRELVLSPETPPAVRLEAARALGAIRTKGGEADADRLASDATPKGTVGRLAAAWVLRRHAGDEAVRRLQAFARDPEPPVAAVAVVRLIELDPALAEPVLPAALASPDANVRSSGVDVLSRRPSEPHVRLLADRLSDPHPDVRSQARRVMHEQGKAELRAAVLREGERVLAGKDWRGKEQAAVLLAQLDHKPAAGRLVELLKDDRAEAAVAAAWALRVLAVPETFPKAFEHFRHTTSRANPPAWADRQLTHLVQMLGEARYTAADGAFRGMVSPKAPAGFETRAAACWALGLFHEGKPDAGLERALAGRVAAVNPGDFEDEHVRWMSAVSLGRMRGQEGLATLRNFWGGSPALEPVNNACGWAIEQITGEKVPPPGVIRIPQIGWFLTYQE
jgi:HEAT repeat protein